MSNQFLAYSENPAHYRAALIRSIEETALVGREQLSELQAVNSTLDGVLTEMAAIRRTQAEGLALQQAMLAREVFQDRMEEFVFQFDKLIGQCERSGSDFPPAMQFYLLDGMFKQIDAAGISTAVIKGRDNKAAFDACVARGKTLFKQLVKHPDVRQAIAWAESEQKKRLALDQKRAGDVQQRRDEIKDISRQIERLEESRVRFTYMEWLNYKFESLPPPARVVIGVLWVALLYPFFKFTGSADERAANAATDEKIERLQQRLTDLQADE